MPTLQQDLKSQAEWIVKAFAADRLKLDYTIESFMEIDRFFNKHSKDGKPKTGGRLATRKGLILFSIAGYIGETIIKNVPGSVWVTDDEDPEGEVNVSVKLPDGITVYPAQRAMKRLQNGAEDSIYVYGFQVTKDFTGGVFDESYWTLDTPEQNKPWWKLW